jgi:hypothetical protein
MRRILLPLVASLLAATASAGTIQQQLTPPNSGSNSSSSEFEFGFQLNGFNLSSEAVIIEFDASVYLSLLNATAPAGFTALALQPGTPPGAPGDLVLEEMSGGPILNSVGMFDVNFLLSSTGQPGALPYFVFSVNSDGAFGDLIDSGTTTVQAATTTPEPQGFALVGMSIFAAAVLRSVRRQREERPVL